MIFSQVAPGMESAAFQYIIQGGFAVFALALLFVLWHVVRDNNKTRDDREDKLIDVLKETNQVITGNTQVLSKLTDQNYDTMRTLADIRDRLLERPCMLPRNP